MKFKKTIKNFLIDKPLVWLFLVGIFFEIFVWYRLPKQAWVEGLLESWYTYNGLVFYRDFTNQYFPFLHMLMVPYHQLFGFIQTPTLLLAPLNSLLLLLLLFFLSIKWLTGWRRILPILFFLLWDPILSENHFSTAAFHETVNFLAFILWLFWFDKPSKLLAFVIGFCLSASIFSMHITIFFAGAVFLSMLLKIVVAKNHISSFIYAILGFLIPVIIILLWFIYKNAVYDLLWWNIIYYMKHYPYTKLGRGLISIIMFVAVFSPLLIYLKILYTFIKRKSFSKYDKKDINIALKLLSVNFILITLPASIWFAIFHHIRFQIALPIYAFALGLGFEWVKIYQKRLGIFVGLIGLIILIFNILSIYYYMIPRYKSSLAYPRERNIITKLYTDDPMYTAVEWIKNNTPKDAKLFVLADPMFHIETERLPANARGTMNQPFTYEPLSELSLQLKQNPPDYWVVDERLVYKRFYEYGYPHTVKYFDKLLNCEPVAARIEYITIRKHEKKSKLCVE